MEKIEKNRVGSKTNLIVSPNEQGQLNDDCSGWYYLLTGKIIVGRQISCPSDLKKL
jgi:hypothetical protein